MCQRRKDDVPFKLQIASSEDQLQKIRTQREEKEATIRKKWDSLLAESEQEEMVLKRDLKGLQQTMTSEGSSFGNR